jgi:periplasmic copper chaperone A
MSRRSVTASLAVAALVWLAAPAWAHVEVSPSEAPAGSTVDLEFEVGHGCDGSPVVAVSIRMPEGVTDISPEDREGWTYSVATVDGLDVVTWEGGPQGANEHGSFFMTVTLPAAEGEVLAFPAVQICEEGEVAWIELPAADGSEPANPAPLLTLTAGDPSATTTTTTTTTIVAEDPAEGEEPVSDETGGDVDVTETTAQVTATTAAPTTTLAPVETTVPTVVAAEQEAEDGPGLGVAVAVAGAVVALGGGLSLLMRRRART